MMGFFGMSESELKKFAEELAKRDTSLKNKAVDLESQGKILAQGLASLQKERAAFETEKATFSTSSANALEQIAQERKQAIEQAKAWLERAKKAFEEEKKAFESSSSETLGKIGQEQAKLEARRQELLQLEAEAKNGFVSAQNDSFREIFETRQQNLDAQKESLNAIIADAKERLGRAFEKEGEIAKRELAVTEREQQAEAGFADRTAALAHEAKKQHEANLAEASKLKDQEARITEKRDTLKAFEEALRQREEAIRNAEQERDNGYSEARAALDAELADKKEKYFRELQSRLSKCNDDIAAKYAECNQAISSKQKEAQEQFDKAVAEIAQYREDELKKIELEIASIRKQRLVAVSEAENVERDRIRKEIEESRRAFENNKNDIESVLQAQRTELAKQKATLLSLESELAGQKQQLEQDAKRLEAQENRNKDYFAHRNEIMESEIAEKIRDAKTSFEAQLDDCRRENQRLLEQLHIQSELLGAFEILKKQLGDQDPSEVILRLNSQTDELRQLREKLATLPSEEMRERYRILEAENQELKKKEGELINRIASCDKEISEVNILKLRNSDLETKNQIYSQKATLFEGQANQAIAELERLRAAYERPAELEARYKEIELPYLTGDKVVKPQKSEEPVNELEWLKQISDSCDEYGLHFNPRIVKAFHTALKTAEWSPLTILAGVSGTGKSELPRLYSHFGGLFFEPLSVQPNWDSQESMLGFFNSIDNKFDAQPVLRFLAQSQKEWSDTYPGLKEDVCMVLLDEMNLAHPELYFAEFLSKLELRRGKKSKEVPTLPVKIGAGLKPYELPLGRNVLWAGTMNQDETTKSLSDKVLDRSIIIYFPRPTRLERRLTLKPLDHNNRGKILPYATWKSWLMQECKFTDAEVGPFKKFIEDMNNALGKVGRAIGHRVWQSVEYYMANYPDVRIIKSQKDPDKAALTDAMYTAFEDQLVQKVMPKLRGIDTRGDSKSECLGVIRRQISAGINGHGFNLDEDFDLACELGYGQFIWQSANYLKEAQNGETP